MGTPAFPNLGKHCNVDDCCQIDFLPFTCDRCQKAFCVAHRSYAQHKCPHANNQGVTVIICPLCAKGVRLIPGEDPNITWESHVDTVCDPTNYEKATKKRKCPAPSCKETLVFSNTIKCRDCSIDHCLKHRFGLDHKCPGPSKPNPGFQFTGRLNSSSRKGEVKPSPASAQPSSTWARLVNVASAARAVAEASMTELGNEFNQVLQVGPGTRNGTRGGGPGAMDVCSGHNAGRSCRESS